MKSQSTPIGALRNTRRLLPILLLLVLGGLRGFAETITVTNAADIGPGSLRAAIAGAANGDTIIFANTLAGQTIALSSGEIGISNRLTIDGSALAQGVQISGGNLSRIFSIASGGNLTLDALTLRDGNGGGGDGGAILSVGTAVLNGCTLTANATGSGGAIVNNAPGNMTLNNCTLTGNASALAGGGGAIVNRAILSLNNCTLAGNTSNNGGSIYNDFTGVLHLTNSIVTGPNSSIENFGTLNGSSNLVDTANINLASLGNYGGPTQTMPPLPGSPAVDAGNDAAAGALATDQRGYSRIAGAHVDIGAVEAGNAIPGNDYTVVTTTNDFLNGLTTDGVSLRNAAAFATNHATITFAPDLDGQSILLTNGQIVLATNLTMDASALSNGLNIYGKAYALNNGYIDGRVLKINPGTVVTLKSLTIAGGNFLTTNENGAGVLNAGDLTLDHCKFYFDNGYNGGAIYNDGGNLTLKECEINNCFGSPNIVYSTNGILSVTNSTFHGNQGGNVVANDGGTATVCNSTFWGNQLGGQIFNTNGATMLINSTFAANDRLGGVAKAEIISEGTNILTAINCTCASNGNNGLYATGAPLNLTNCVITTNQLGNTGYYDVYSNTVVHGAGNVIGVGDANFAPLGNYGGPVPTLPPLPGSPAIDAGSDSVTNFLTTDERRRPRLVGTHVDAGAVEFGYSLVVSNASDPVLPEYTLRAAVGEAQPGDIITFAPALAGSTIEVTNGSIVIDGQVTNGTNVLARTVTIDATGLPGGLVVSGEGKNRVFEVSPYASAILNGLTIANGNGTNTSKLPYNGGVGFGGGIANYNGQLTLNNCTLANNHAQYGGAIFSAADGGKCDLLLNNCTVEKNTSADAAIEGWDNNQTLNNCTVAGNSGVGIYLAPGGSQTNFLTVNNCTIVGNSLGILVDYNYTSYTNTLNLTNSILADNAGSNLLNRSAVLNEANNLVDATNIALAPLGNYGGPTMTMPPMPGSPAIDAGDDAVLGALSTDQRGYPRKSGAHVDIGAVEVQFVAANPNNPPVLKNSVWSATTNGGAFQFAFTNLSGADFTALAATNLALPLTNWTVLGNIPEIAPGIYQFADPSVTHSPQRFYRVVSP